MKKIKLSVRRTLANDSVTDAPLLENQFINGVIFKSSEGVLMLYSESRFITMWVGYVQKAYLRQSRGVGKNLIGTFTQYRSAERGTVSLVPMLLEKISDTESKILSAPRRSTRYAIEDIPPHVQTHFKTVEVPECRF